MPNVEVNRQALPEEDLRLAMRHAPVLLMDELEPFFPVRIGITVLRENGLSPSFGRRPVLRCPPSGVVIEYAIYYDYDIQHLYDLEHVWIYVDRDGQTVDAEGSFHGRYFKSLLPDRSNLCMEEETERVVLYVQPGKHALSPLPDLFLLWPGTPTCTQEDAGADGLAFGDFLVGILETNKATDQKVRRRLQRSRFTPTLRYREWSYADQTELWVLWSELLAEIPKRVRHELERMDE